MPSSNPPSRKQLESVAEDLRTVRALKRSSGSTAAKRVVLLFTEDPEVKRVVSAAALTLGAEVFEVCSPAEAAEAARAAFAKLLVVDLRGDRATATAAVVGGCDLRLPVVAVGGEDQLATLVGAAAAFATPVQEPDLRASMQWILEGR